MTSISDNPYIGPRTFAREERDRYYGREQEARELFSLVISERLVLFYAQSGAGKSSLLNTRLIPQLEEAGLSVLPLGRVSGELPAGISQVDNIFVYNLMLSLDHQGDNPQRCANLALTDFLAGLVSSDGEHYTYEPEAKSEAEGYVAAPHVLIVDQFEEIVTTHPGRWVEREGFFRQLDQAMQDDPLLWVVLAFREDYLASIEPFAPLLTGKMRARFFMQRMGYEAALEAVKQPAAWAGRPFVPGAAENLVNNLRQIRAFSGVDLAPDQTAPSPERLRTLGQFIEPVQLQVVCYQLWENLKARPAAEITHQDLRELGNVDTALASFYEQALAKVMAAAGESEIDLREWFEHNLITEAGTRGSVYRGAEKTAGISTRAADLLVNHFVVRTESRAGGSWYELVHDRFVEPILQANQAWRLRQPLLQMAQEWVLAGKSERKLLTGPTLVEALASNWRGLGPLVAEFLSACQTSQQAQEAAAQADKELQRQRELEQARALAEAERHRAEAQAKAARRLGWIVAALGVLLLALVGLIAVALWGFSQRSEVLISHDTITTLLPLDGQIYISVDPNTNAIKIIETNTKEEIFNLPGHTALVSKISLSPQTTYLVSTDQSGMAIVWDLSNGEQLKRLTGHVGTIRYAVFSHDERLLATGGDDGVTRIWDTATWQQMFELRSDGGSIISVAFWADDSRIITATTEGKYTIWDPWSGRKVLSGGR
jgi:hypothetical protein